jgi:hypothetical protein
VRNNLPASGSFMLSILSLVKLSSNNDLLDIGGADGVVVL